MFPREGDKIDTSLSSVFRALARGIDHANVTLVPMIIVEIMRALSKYARDKRCFEGCNSLLQIWTIEHFYR